MIQLISQRIMTARHVIYSNLNLDLIMTDDKATVELLGMQIIDEIIVDEVNYYKRIYKDKGLSGLLELI